MEFNNAPPEWENKGAEPGEDLKKQGFLAGYKPPAAYFNWFWNKTSACIKELQEKLKGITKSDVGLDKVDNKSLEEILTEVTMDKANAKDTSGLVGAVQENVKAQQLLDELANRVATKLVEKGMIANNLVTTNENMVLAAPMGKNLQEQISDVNKNIANIIGSKDFTGSIKDFALTCNRGITVFSTTSETKDLPAQTTEWLYTTGYVLKRYAPGNTLNIILYGYMTNRIAIISHTNAQWTEWDILVKNSDLYGMYSIGNDTTFAKVLEGRNNKITPFTFYVPADNPFSFSMGYGIAFNSSMLHNDKMFTLLGFEKTGTKIEVKQFTIT